jgi:hypothetical protein
MNDNYEKNYLADQEAEPIGVYASKAFGWMFLGLVTTFLTSLIVLSNPTLIQMFFQSIYAFYALMGAELILVWVLSANIQKMSFALSKFLFFVYAAVNGITFSVIFFVYQMESIISIFAITALFFGVMALYGYLTKNDLTSIGRVLTFGVFFLVGFWILSMFINLSQFEIIVSFIGMLIFLGLTAYDTQKIKYYYNYYQNDSEMLKKASIISALQLYLDFINLFLYLLRILGRRK